MRITIVIVVLLVVAGVVAFFAIRPGPKAAEGAVDFTLPDQDGGKVSLADYRGKTVVLEWINWDCPFSKRQYTSGTMKRLAEKYAPRGVVWLAVNSTHYATPEKDKEWIRQYDLPYRILNDNEGAVGKRFEARTTPHMFIIDKTGRIAYRGAIDDDAAGNGASVNYVEQALEEILAGETVSRPQTTPYGCSVKYKN